MMVVFEKCDPVKTPGITCKTDKEIEQYMVKNKMHIITITNQKRFVQYKFGEERI